MSKTEKKIELENNYRQPIIFSLTRASMLSVSVFWLYALIISAKSFTNANTSTKSDSDPQLLQLITVVRNGARSPIKLMPTLPSCSSSFPYLYELTDLGQQQLYTLGTQVRDAYSSFLSDSFNPDDFYFRAVDQDPSLMSGASFAQGLFASTSATSSLRSSANDLSSYIAPVCICFHLLFII